MKKLLIRLLTILIYITALLGLVNFQIWVLLNIKMMIMVALGTLLLTLSNYKKGMAIDDLKTSASWNAMLTSYLTTFILLFSRLSNNQEYTNLLKDVAMNCRPLLYGLIINILLKSELPKSIKEIYKDSAKSINDTEADKQKLKAAGLTEREVEIALYILKGISNKEIGEKLYISESTVKKHTSNFYKKINVKNREQLKQYISKLI
jgi:DNA-binding CsgD family transcriptional regulator